MVDKTKFNLDLKKNHVVDHFIHKKRADNSKISKKEGQQHQILGQT